MVKLRYSMDMQKLLKQKISQLCGDVDFSILISSDPKLGDYSTNVAFILAKSEHKSPKEVAERLSKEILADGSEILAKAEVAGAGYINFFLKPEFLQAELKRIHEHREHYGRQDIGQGKSVIVEYSSPNIAKPMHIGHLRSTIIGDALANIYEALGYKVIRWNYIGDWGTQFGKLIAHVKKLYPEWEKNLDQIFDPVKLLAMYVAANHPDYEDKGREEFAKLEQGDEENRKLWSLYRQTSIESLNGIYRQLGVNFSLFKGESDYEKELKPIIEWLQKEEKIKESEGALIFDLSKYNLPPGLLRKSDGATLYLTRDLASLGDRLKTYAPVKIVYVVANQQALHFEQLFAIARELGMDSAELSHVKFGMVLGEDGKKLATREGNAVPLQEVIDKIVALAANVVKQKNLDISEEGALRVSEAVGVGALKYNDLKQHPHSDIIFNWEQMLDLTGNSGPYLQYTYARLQSIIGKADRPQTTDYGLQHLNHPLELRLIKILLDFPDAVEKCTQEHALNGLALYLYELAGLASRYYEEVRILQDPEDDRKNARLVLIETVAATLKNGLKLLGIKTLERI